MELRNLRIFVMAAKCLNFSKVADTMFLSQSSVSKYISALENELGQELFQRDTKTVRLTEFGTSFLPYAKDILYQEERATEFLHDFNVQKLENNLVLGVGQSLTYAPAELCLFRMIQSIHLVKTMFPHTNIRMKYYPDEELISLLQSGRIDIAVITSSRRLHAELKKQGLDFRIPELQRNVLLYSDDLGTFQTFEELVSHIRNVIYTDDPTPKALTHELLRILPHEFTLKPCQNWPELFVQVLEGSCVAIVPEPLILLAENCGISYVPLDDEIASCLNLIWCKANTSEPLLALVDEICTQLQESPYRMEEELL